MFVAAEPDEVHLFCYGGCACDARPPRLALSEVLHAPADEPAADEPAEDFVEVGAGRPAPENFRHI